MKPELNRHPEAVAIDQWFESKEGQGCLSDSILKPNQSVYLENRLRHAFEAGWKAAKARVALMAAKPFLEEK